MIKIVKNDTNIKELEGKKYVLRAEPKGIGPMYAKISLRPIIGYFLAIEDFRKNNTNEGSQ